MTTDQLTPGTWTIDASHSSVGFVARHLMVAKVRGRFTGVNGTVVVAEDLLDSTVTATIETATVDTNDDARDGHLRSADFLDVEQFPQLLFTSTAIHDKGDHYVLEGDLEIKGVSRRVELDLEFDGVSRDPWGGTRAGFTASTQINRKDWGLTWNVALETGGVLVGDQVKIELDIEAVQA